MWIRDRQHTGPQLLADLETLRLNVVEYPDGPRDHTRLARRREVSTTGVGGVGEALEPQQLVVVPQGVAARLAQ